MRIVILADNLWAGGKERRLLEMLKAFSTYSDIDLHLVLFKDRIHYKEVHDLNIPITIIKRVPEKNPIVFFKLYKLCKNFKPDIIHSWSSMSTLWAIPSAVFLGVKIINGNIADAPANLKFFDRRRFRAMLTFPFSKVIVANSFAGLKAYNAPMNKSECVYNAFDIKRIANIQNPDSVREKFHIETTRIVGMVGSFIGNKDYQTYIEAALLLFELRDDVTFLAIGDGKDLEKFKKLVPSKYTSRFIFTGLQSNVESIVNIFDIGVLSTYTEGISNAILEYMALGKPAIATIGGGTVETIEDDITGYLIPPDSPKLMADKLNYLLDNEAVLKEMGVAGKQRLQTVFSVEKMISSYYKIYRDNI